MSGLQRKGQALAAVALGLLKLQLLESVQVAIPFATL